jgi:hypothetical protein
MNWKSVKENELPNDGQYHLVVCELEHPYPERGLKTVRIIRSASYDYLNEKVWKGENGIVVNNVTHFIATKDIPLP